MVEICCGSYYDALQAALGGAERIELNSGLYLGGLTPSIAALELVKEHTKLTVIAMTRPRGGGFCYSSEDFQLMLRECKQLLESGADGIAFGCLKEDASIDQNRNKELISLIHSYGRKAVFHRAFDCTRDGQQSMEILIDIGVDRVLTSGLKPKAMEGRHLLKALQQQYGEEIEILAGSGIHASNACQLIEDTGISQIHSSCKDWVRDSTTMIHQVSYSFAPSPYEDCYDVVSAEHVKELLEAVRGRI